MEVFCCAKVIFTAAGDGEGDVFPSLKMRNWGKVKLSGTSMYFCLQRYIEVPDNFKNSLWNFWVLIFQNT